MIVESNPQSRQFFIDLPQTGLFSGIQSGTRTDKSFIILVQDVYKRQIVDITNEQQIAETVSKYNIDTIYNLAALLSAVAEASSRYFSLSPEYITG